jgi:CRP/FNR family cyclic AMP-dependent transcriptional regulator
MAALGCRKMPAMAPILNVATVLQKLLQLPLEVYEAGALVLAAGATTGKLLILKEGAVEVAIQGVPIAEVAEPGAVFGELAILLGQPHTADVRTLQPSTFYIADGGAILRVDPAAALHVARVLAERLDAVNRSLIAARHRLTSEPRSRIFDEIIDNLAQSLRYCPPM